MGNQEFLKAYDAYADAIFRHCYFRVFNRERAKDLMQETFAKTWEYFQKGTVIENLRAFLYKVANNLIIDESRKRQMTSLEEMQETGFDVGDNSHKQMEFSAETGQLMKFIQTLDVKYREPIIMKYVDDLSLKEIAEALGETENNIAVRIHRGIKRIQEKYEV